MICIECNQTSLECCTWDTDDSNKSGVTVCDRPKHWLPAQKTMIFCCHKGPLIPRADTWNRKYKWDGTRSQSRTICHLKNLHTVVTDFSWSLRVTYDPEKGSKGRNFSSRNHFLFHWNRYSGGRDQIFWSYALKIYVYAMWQKLIMMRNEFLIGKKVKTSLRVETSTNKRK